ncbi:hypothetical protein [Nocardioides bruguierae]|uniref:Uncharacterized protein n=1 Tax=Nocardioides bruguierae TaxID=2945102 RepID=A0A9X2DCV4_9ACTN|nr:hypothetical protein [Nocardioides bruguierae]MCL8027536.1 hypothetical protein [Nocardioides bruguierae]MCM0622139.1 hypothetical protein [Nocardioides bruguierae]
MAPTFLGRAAGTAAGVALLPWRLTLAATRTTLALGELASPDGPVRRPGGYRDQLEKIVGPGGQADRLMALLDDPDGPIRLATTVAELIAPDRPLGRMLARDGVLDRLLADGGPVERLLTDGGAIDRLAGEGGALDRLTEEGGVLERLLAVDGAVDRLTREDGLLEQVLRPGGLADRMLADDGFLETMLAEGGTLDQLIALGDTLEALQPRLAELARLVPALSGSADALERAVGPIGEIAGMLPFGRRRPGSGPVVPGGLG